MIYLASPYTHPLASVRTKRFHAARDYAMHCMRQGEVIISPIAYGHQFATNYGARIDHMFWWKLSVKLMARSEEVRVLQIPGWDKSFGVAAEIKHALTHGILVTYAKPLNTEGLE